MWQPSSSIQNLRQRAMLLQKIRQFFATRDILEVETPLLCHTSVTDPYIESMGVDLSCPSIKARKYYLQTSPEYAMKRLLAAGSGPIYQICKAFRQEELGTLHNPEFTILEWYRPGFTHHQLMDEMDTLLQEILLAKTAQRYSYRELFLTFLKFDPEQTSLAELKNFASQHEIYTTHELSQNDWLMLLMSKIIEPQLGWNQPCFIYDFPPSQAALARIIEMPSPVASRFEVYINGIELANGFHELTDSNEQRKRFEKNNLLRKNLNLKEILLDEYLLAALQHGLPDCAGVALGLDRLMMIALNSKHIAEVLSFDISRA